MYSLKSKIFFQANNDGIATTRYGLTFLSFCDESISENRAIKSAELDALH